MKRTYLFGNDLKGEECVDVKKMKIFLILTSPPWAIWICCSGGIGGEGGGSTTGELRYFCSFFLSNFKQIRSAHTKIRFFVAFISVRDMLLHRISTEEVTFSIYEKLVFICVSRYFLRPRGR